MIIIDTGAFLALFNQRDPNHQATQIALRSIQEPLILIETCYFLLARNNSAASVRFLRQVANGICVTCRFS
nr:hypothetical protein [Leptolyngbya sp. FACHB-17]